MIRENCIVCGAKLYKEPIISFDNMPSGAQNMPLPDELENDKGIHLDLCQCKGCGLVQFNCEPVEYYKDSTRAGEKSRALISLRQKQYKHLFELFKFERNIKLLEVGAGKGGFLNILKEMYPDSISELGIENNLEFVKIANDKEGVHVIQGFLDSSDLILEGAPFDVFTSFAYPARLVDPNSMLQCVYNNLTEDGVGLVMVPSFEHLLEKVGMYDICNDHIAYYNRQSLEFLLNKNGFEIVEQGEEGGIYIYAYVRKKRLCNIQWVKTEIDSFNHDIQTFVNENTTNEGKLAVWCAGHFAFTVISMAGIEKKIDYIIDNAEFKQGRYSPASHIPIVGKKILCSDKSIQAVLILGPLYIDEIIDDIRNVAGRDIQVAWIKDGCIESTIVQSK